MQLRRLLVLGIESSADDSCAAIVECVGSIKTILASVVLKQQSIHEAYGGIHPLYAQKAHQRNVPLAIRQALLEARVQLHELDAIAYTRGPGMNACLAVGATAAKTLAAVTNKPLIGVHHMQAHALTVTLTESTPPPFPFLTLLLSGGHTLLVLARSESQFQILATTTDESIGYAMPFLA